MNARDQERLAELFDRAISGNAGAREAVIAEAAAADRALAQALRELLAAHDTADEYFDGLARDVIRPAVAAAALDESESDTDLMNRLQTAIGSAYKLERELGGGMSRVFLATEARLDRKVVIKVLPQAMSVGVSVERFRREIQLSARLQHPHIVHVLTTDAADGFLYYVMPYVDGETLRARLAQDGALAVTDAVAIWRDLLDALGFAHQRGIIHRVVKPENILLSGRNALVADFGIARAIEAAVDESGDVTGPGATLGTPAYMAPEQVAGESGADHRIDIYAAGLVMYEMLCGRKPFAGLGTRDLALAHLTQPAPPIERPDVPQWLASLVMRCLEKRPEARPEGAEMILRELDRAPTGAEPRLRRMRSAVVVAAFAALGIAVVIGYAYYGRGGGGSRTDARRYTASVEAYEWYKRGMDVALMRNSAGREKALEYFNNAIAVDSNFAAAYAGLSRILVQMDGESGGASQRHRFALAEQAAKKAVALDDSLAETHTALGWVYLAQNHFAPAESAFTRAASLNPGAPRLHEGRARLYMETGRPVQQLSEARRGMEIDPFSHSAIREMALALMMNGRCNDALALLRPLKTLTPPAGVAGVISGQCYAAMQMWPEAIAEFRWVVDSASGRAAPAFLAHALARGGHAGEARSILSDLLTGKTDSHGAFGIAVAYAGLRDYDNAFLWLARAADERSIRSYIVGPMFADLHRDRRFLQVMDRLQSQKR